jgi:AcrR family transcriptional regulator
VTEARTRGRPRSETADRAIIEATVALLAERGYQAMSMDAVAAAAGVGKPTVYRRYASKADLVVAALLATTNGPAVDVPDDTAGALAALLGHTALALANPGGMTILGTLLAQERRDPVLIATFRDRVFRPRHEVVRTILERGVERGEIEADTDLDMIGDLLFGFLLARAMLGESVDPASIPAVVATVLAAVRPSSRRQRR